MAARKIIYIETSIPSALVDARDDVTSRFQQQQTRLWWEHFASQYLIVSSDVVLAELNRTAFPRREEAVHLVQTLPLLPLTEEVIGVAKVYQEHLVMPNDTLGDAVHVALACVHEVDYLLTWNCRHLANPNKTQHLQVINLRLGLLTPALLTPPMLMQEER